MSSVWHQEPSGFSPCMEIDSSSVRSKERLATPAWLKQEQDQLRIIKWEGCQTPDAVQDNTPSSAMSGKRRLGFLPAVTAASSSPPRSCLARGRPPAEGAADHHQAAVHAGEQAGAHRRPGETGGGPDAGPQVPPDADREPDQQQVHAAFPTSHVRRSSFIFPNTQGCSWPARNIFSRCFSSAPRPGKAQRSESKSRKRERASCSSSDGSRSGSEASESSEVSAASTEHRRRKHHKEKKRSKKAKDYSRKRGSTRAAVASFEPPGLVGGACYLSLLVGHQLCVLESSDDERRFQSRQQRQLALLAC